MIFQPLALESAYLITPEYIEDQRGLFARTFCQEEFKKRGLNPHLEQCSLSYNYKKGTLRGMHYQKKPHEEAKVVRCIRGSVYDVIIDLRPSSLTYKKWIGVELTAANRKLLYIPEGFAHGFLTLEDHTELFYQISTAYVASSARGIRWSDPCFAIEWPLKADVISEKDQGHPLFV